MEYDYQFHAEWIQPSAVLVQGAVVCGNVHVGAHSSIWFNAVVRGDTEQITIGESTNIQDHCLVHADKGIPCFIGDRVTLGHSAIVHGATVENDVMIGIRATVLNEAVIGSGSLIAAGAVVPERTVIPPNSLVMGIPGKVKRPTTEKDLQRIQYAANHYVQAGQQYRRQNQA